MLLSNCCLKPPTDASNLQDVAPEGSMADFEGYCPECGEHCLFVEEENLETSNHKINNHE